MNPDDLLKFIVDHGDLIWGGGLTAAVMKLAGLASDVSRNRLQIRDHDEQLKGMEGARQNTQELRTVLTDLRASHKEILNAMLDVSKQARNEAGEFFKNVMDENRRSAADCERRCDERLQRQAEAHADAMRELRREMHGLPPAIEPHPFQRP